MASVDEGFKQLLQAHAPLAGWWLEVGELPAKPDRAIQILQTGGLEPNPKWLLDFPSAQITVRGGASEYRIARDIAYTVKDLLLGLPAQTVNGDRWVSVTIGSDVAFVGRDDNDRPLFTVNFRLIVEPAATPDTNRLAL